MFVANSSARNIVINSIQSINQKDMPKLGRLFLSSAYLMVNHDARSFTLWQAATDADSSNLQAVGEDGKFVGGLCPGDDPANNATATTSAIPSPTGSSGTSLSGGAIAGIVIAALVAVGAFGFSGLCVWRRKHRNTKNEIPNPYAQTTSVQGYPDIPYSVLEVADTSVPGVVKQQHEMFQPQELATRRTEPMELDSTAVPASRGA
jgi:hypothetical protein